MMKNSNRLLKRNSELYSIAAQFWIKRILLNEGFFLSQFNHDIGHELAERGLPQYLAP